MATAAGQLQLYFALHKSCIKNRVNNGILPSISEDVSEWCKRDGNWKCGEFYCELLFLSCDATRWMSAIANVFAYFVLSFALIFLSFVMLATTQMQIAVRQQKTGLSHRDPFHQSTVTSTCSFSCFLYRCRFFSLQSPRRKVYLISVDAPN